MLIHVSSNNNLLKEDIKSKSPSRISPKPSGLYYALGGCWLVCGMTGAIDRNFIFSDDGMKELQEYKEETQKIFNGHFTYKLTVDYTDIDNPDKNKVVNLNTVEDFDKFTLRYGVYEELDLSDSDDDTDNLCGIININWKKVSQDFGGIQTIPYFKDRRRYSKKYPTTYMEKFGNITKNTCLWASTLDIPGGVVWNKQAIYSWGQIDINNLY
jgi:hypothetical protein